ncbi:MAG: DUF423 domain-containing protein [Myxococcales bacterium]|nr:DUF423 domain-containing protein [Myxococcales bacterium]
MDRILVMLAALYGLTAVGLGAFGAHGLEARLAGLADGAQRMQWWQTAAHYHLLHALAIGLAAWVATRFPGTPALLAGLSFALGVLLFSGSLYAMTLTGLRWLGAVTPLGGLLLLAGWAALGVAAYRGG